MSDLAHGPTLAAGAPASPGGGERLEIGARAGDYVIDRFLGAGAMGEVYAGRQPTIGKRVAIKVLRRELASDAEAAERFTREARAANQVDHPGVIDVFAFGRLDDGRLYLVMDLVDGRSLRAELAGGALELPRALEILDGIAAALDAAHARGVVHRDLKPDNIMISSGERRDVFVLDFGIAKLLAPGETKGTPGTLTGAGTWLGTPSYMAPEQWSADGAGPASDRYALGVIAYELLAGAAPFSATSVPAMMEQHFRAAVPSLSAKGTVPSAVDDVLRRALAKDPEARFPTARALVAALREASGTGLGARAALAPPEPAGATVRRPWLPAAAGAGVLGVALVAGFAIRGGGAAGEREPSAPPAAAAGPTRGVIVRSVPAGAKLWRAGAAIGATPLTVPLAAGERAELELRAPGFLAAKRVIAGGDPPADVTLDEVSRFAGVWRLPGGELRALERAGDRVAVSKLDSAGGPRKFYKYYPFVDAEHGIAFAADEELVDPRAPDDRTCHVPLRVEYDYDPASDALVLHRPKIRLAFDGHGCTVLANEPSSEPIERVAGEHDTVELVAPAGVPPKLPPGKATFRQAAKPAPVFDTSGPAPASPYAKTKADPTDNIGQVDRGIDPANDIQQQAAPPQAQILPKSQAPPIQVQQSLPARSGK